ncbi:type I-U CRISPR-associated protein Csx17 [Candidatus Palauibacter sp.]|uniref:type I-G CRISPR-associated protein Cas8g1/Csx17 n=1 Tax=Candidatus Palauibacter sp. TaxID=3101350 RepID=UPI003B01D660
MSGERLILHGCSPTPLASYLKALGVLRLLSSDANNVSGDASDSEARGWWREERFHLQTSLGSDGLLEFFLRDYAPSPVIAPWNGGSGFYPKDNQDGFGPLNSGNVAARFRPFAKAVRVSSEVLRDLGLKVRPQGDEKAQLVGLLRAQLPESALPWLDATLVLSSDGLGFPPLLGTGGNDGRLDFTNNLMQRLVSAKASTRGIFDAASGEPSPEACALLEGALFDRPIYQLTAAAVGQFSPGGAGGPNAATAYEGASVVNPWDYVLMLEGATTFACAAARRYEGKTISRTSFPFTVGAVGAGSGGVESSDESDARAEFWAPLWTRAARFLEIEALFGEGRAVANGRTARDGLGFARALASLGIGRGFSEFQRYGFFKRAGKNHHATAISRRPAEPSEGAELLADLDEGGWLDRARRFGRDGNQPATLRNVVKVLEDALFELLSPAPPPRLVSTAMEAIGRLAQWLSVSPHAQAKLGPPPLLSRRWLSQADDGTPEFRIAAALGGLGIPTRLSTEASDSSEVRFDRSLAPPMAAHLAPLTNGRSDGFEGQTFFRGRLLRKHRAWARDNNPPTVVWGHGRLVANMIAVLERRLLESSIRGLMDKPLESASFARLSDVAAFLSGEFDDARCSTLLAGMVWAQPVWPSRERAERDAAESSVPFAYAALKPIFSSDAALARAGVIPGGATMPIPPGLIGRLRGSGGNADGRVSNEAVRMAFARARASGLPSPYDPIRSGGGAAGLSRRIGAGIRPDRLAAAMLIPVSERDLTSLLKRAYPNEIRHVTSSTGEALNVS